MVYLKKLELENVRCFGKKQRIDFTGSDGKISQWTVILGDNSTGKTSILRSIVSLLPSPQNFLFKRDHTDTKYELSIHKWMNLWSPKRKIGEYPSSISLSVTEFQTPFQIEDYTSKLEVDIAYSKSEGSKNSIVSVSEFDTLHFTPVYCFAYGANRKMSEKSLGGDNLLKPNETLFDDEALLQNSEEYFLQLDYETAKSRKGSDEINKVKDLLLKLLPVGLKDIRVGKIGRLQREVQVETPFGWVAINELSLGYKTTIAWLVDFAAKMLYYHEKSSNPFAEPAILILDEIDLHMHPTWQKEIIENLSHLFPKTQFIVTAHSPLIVQAAINSNLILLKRVRDNISVINEPDIIKSWRIDQILTSDLFGMKEVRNTEVEKVFSKRRSLIMKDHLTQQEEDELQHLEDKIDEIPVAETQEYIKAMEIIQKAAKKV